MNKESFESLLDNLDREERAKFDYILNFYTQEHVYYNFDSFRKDLKDFKVFQVEPFIKPVDEKLKKLLDKIDLKSILGMLETFKIAFYNNTENKSVTDMLIYLTTFADVKEKTRFKIIESSQKYKRIVESGIITPEEILNIIVKNFERAISIQEKLDLERIEFSINFQVHDLLKSSNQRNLLEKDLYENEPLENRPIILSEVILKMLDRNDIREAFERDGNVYTKNNSILVIKAILGDEFENADDSLIERLKAMLNKFDLARMTDEEIKLFKDNMQDIIQKGIDIEDIFFIKNISSNEDALLAYSKLPEELKKQVLSLNVIAKKDEIANVLNALTFIKEEKKKDSKTYHDSIGLSEKLTFGIELELVGMTPETLKALQEKRELYKNFKLKYGLNSGFHDWTIDSDGTVPDGVELISFVMKDTKEDWDSLKEVCTAMNALNSSVGATCGGHIHIGANILGTDEEAWKNLFKIWKISEPIIYKVSNKEGEEPRRGTLKEASPVASIIDDMFEKDLIKIENHQDVKKLATEYTRRFINGATSSGRTKSMNLQCIAEGKQDTIEFRIPNSLLDPVELQNNIKLFAKIVEVSKKMSDNKEYKNDIFEKLMPAENEEDKMKALMDLLFDDVEDKKVFYGRYYSREKELAFEGKKYSDILTKDVGVNENERYEWRGRR